MRVLFVSAEVAPFAKAGGLADVALALPRALAEHGADVRVVMPKYRSVVGTPSLRELVRFTVPVGGEAKDCVTFAARLPESEVPINFLGHDPYFDRPQIYGEGREYADALARFTFLSRGSLALCEAVSWLPDIVHANDWHTALIPAYLRTTRGGAFSQGTKTVLTIHNLAYQGVFPASQGPVTGLSPEALRSFEDRGTVNLLKGGIRQADLLTTVSPTYAAEILDRGEGLEQDLRGRRGDLVGVLNGVDTSVWDPKRDPHLWVAYSAGDLSGRRENKRRLQSELGLDPDANVPVVGMISRLAEQKGFDLVMPAFPRIMSLGIQFVLLGTGDPRFEAFFCEKAAQYPRRVSAQLSFSETWAHRIEGSCDIFLMPSRFEPCGLNQMYSLRYGAVPVVRATGGLEDTISEYDAGSEAGTGFLFSEYSEAAMLAALARALEVYRSAPEAWRRLQQRGMRQDLSWDASARRYVALYERVIAQG